MLIRLGKSEQIITTARRHGIIYFWWWFLIFILIVTPFFFMFWLFRHSWWGQLLFFLSITMSLFLLIRTLFLWKKNVAIITTHRIIDVDQRGFFDKLVSEMSYDELNYVAGHIKGFWGTCLRYGIVTIVNENENVKIILQKIKQPVRVQQKINDARKNYDIKYSDAYICLDCEGKRGKLVDVLEKKLYKLELVELIRLKKVLDQKIEKMLQEANDK